MERKMNKVVKASYEYKRKANLPLSELKAIIQEAENSGAQLLEVTACADSDGEVFSVDFEFFAQVPETDEEYEERIQEENRIKEQSEKYVRTFDIKRLDELLRKYPDYAIKK